MSVMNLLANRYQLVERIGTNELIYLYHAVDRMNGSDVLVKLLRPEWMQNPDKVARFQAAVREARDAQNNVIKIIEQRADTSDRFLVESYVCLKNRYTLVEQIGSGGMAFVYRAIDLHMGRYVAVKILRPEFVRDPEYVKRFQREADAASKMTNHNIVNLLDVGLERSFRFLVMEFVEGKTLKQLIQEKRRLAPESAVQITLRILSALDHAHMNGVIHRDIKPQNVLVDANGYIKVADFGIASIVDAQTLSQRNMVMGSVHYLSPEQAEGKPSQNASDLYSVGVTLYEMLTGRVPFDADTPPAVMLKHIQERPMDIQTLAPDVPAAICRVCMRALEKKPEDRYPSARAMAMDLNDALAQKDSAMPWNESRAPVPAASPNREKQNTAGRRTGTNRTQAVRFNLPMVIMTCLVTLVVIYGLYLGTTAIYEKVVNSAEVDTYVGIELTSAQRSITRAGLQAEVVEINHPTALVGTVVMQAPAEGTSLRKGDVVVLTVSKGPANQSVPDVKGKTREDAQTILKAYGLTLAVMEYLVSTKYQAGQIVSQNPPAGSPCQSGDIVQVSISGGVAYVPRVTGKLLSEAKELISAAGLVLNNDITYIETQEAALHGRVLSQSLTADAQVIQGANITLEVYRVMRLMCQAKITLDLPASEGLTRVRVTLLDGGGEYQVYQSEVPANASRRPEITLAHDTAGSYTYRVYIDGEFKYANTVTFQ